MLGIVSCWNMRVRYLGGSLFHSKVSRLSSRYCVCMKKCEGWYMYTTMFCFHWACCLFSRSTSCTLASTNAGRTTSPPQIVLLSSDLRPNLSLPVDHTILETRRNNVVRPWWYTVSDQIPDQAWPDFDQPYPSRGVAWPWYMEDIPTQAFICIFPRSFHCVLVDNLGSLCDIWPGVHPLHPLVGFYRIMSSSFDRFDCPTQSSDYIYHQHLSFRPHWWERRQRDIPSSSALANSIISSGKISGIPPTFVETTNKPAEAASIILIPKASVKEVLR